MDTVADALTGTILADPHLDLADLDALLRDLENRVLWLSTSIVDHANRIRKDPSGLKVGGHQASSASMATVMTALWFEHLTSGDRVSVKPHASPAFHAIQYLLGELDESYLTQLRAFGGLQSYPSRSKDPDRVDYSTGSVGLGATAPVWGALARRYVEHHFGTGQEIGRQFALIGDAELDEGACWEALCDPHVSHLGEVTWIVDLNRQSLDRVVPGTNPGRLTSMFEAAGWQVITVKYGTAIQARFAEPGGDALKRRLDQMTNGEYQRLLRLPASEIRPRLIDGDHQLGELLAGCVDEDLHHLIRDLGGHDFDRLREAFNMIDPARPTVIFAYTLKGYRLESEGHPQNHSSLMTAEQLRAFAQRVDADPEDPWRRPDRHSVVGELCATVATRLARQYAEPAALPTPPTDLGHTTPAITTTQAALGRFLSDLRRDAPGLAQAVVTVSPDVSSSTNLAGWVNKVGVWSPSTEPPPDWFADDGETLLHWSERHTGQHIELGIAEVNLVGVLAELGATWSRWGRPLVPIGVLYDPFVSRALEPWSFGVYAGGQSILIGTPSGVTLAPEGGAHQSISTPSIGLEQPGVLAYEPAFALEVEWCLLALMHQMGRDGGQSGYLRLSTRPVTQAPGTPRDPDEREVRRREVLAGAYVLQRCDPADVTIAAMGATAPEALEAASRLAAAGIRAEVVCVTSPQLLFAAQQARGGRIDAATWILDRVFPAHRAQPLVTVLDGHPHTLAFLSSVHRVPAVHLGVERFGQSGDLASVYAYHGIDAASIAQAARALIAST